MATNISTGKVPQYQCPLCPKVFPSLLGLTGHTVSHTKEKPFKCDKCNFEASRKCNLDLHKRRHHLSPDEFQAFKKYKCEFCSYKSFGKKLLERHQRKHTGEKPFICKTCNFCTASEYQLKVHGRIHNDERPYPCTFPGCDYRARWSSRLSEHLAVHNEERQLDCPFPGCNFKAKLRPHLKQHLVTHEEPRFPCTYPGCDYKARQRVHLRLHLASHKDERPHACSFSGCTYRAKLPFTLVMHQRIHREERPFGCASCDRRFKRKYDLTLHQRSHTEEPYRCSYPGCAYQDWCNGNFQKHEKTHQLRTIPCTISGCVYKAKTNSALRDHLQSHEDPNYAQCSAFGCNFRSKFPANLKRHMKVHDPTRKKYSCPFCPCYYEGQHNLESHLHSHNGEKPFKCSDCQFRSARVEGIIGHMKRRHGREYSARDFVGHRLKKSKVPKKIPKNAKIKTKPDPKKQHNCLQPVAVSQSYCCCPSCPKLYSENDELDDHVRSHIGGKPFTCPYCHYNCASMAGINDHVRQRHRKVFSFVEAIQFE